MHNSSEAMLNKILCVEDNQIMQNIYRRMIPVAEFAQEVVSVYNGQEAIDYIKELKTSSGDNFPELIFLDLNMPTMSGWTFLEEIEQLLDSDEEEPRVVIVTSSVDPKDVEKAQKYPSIIDFLSKPLTFEMLQDLEQKLDNHKNKGFLI